MGFKGDAHIQIEGLKEMQAAIKAAQGKLPKSIGEAHKEVGRFIIGKIPEGDPHAVGAGSGAKIRPSATKRDVVLRVGHGGRQRKGDQWGKQTVQRFRPGRNTRPYILKTVLDNQDAIEKKFLEETLKAVGPAFFSAE